MIIVRNKVLKYKNFLYKCATGENGIAKRKLRVIDAHLVVFFQLRKFTFEKIS